MAQSRLVECPSGLVVKVREFKVRDEDLLVDPKSIRKGAATIDLLKAITLECESPGLYELVEPNIRKGEEGLQIPWPEVLQGDVQVLLKENYEHTWDDVAHDERKCSRCNNPFKIEINLDEIEIKPLPESSKSHVRTGEPLEVVLPRSEVKVQFRLLRCKDEKELLKIKKSKKDERASAYLRYRVLGIEGVPQPEWKTWLKDLGSYDSSALREAFDEADCGTVGIQDTLECPICEHAWTEEIDFSSDFLFPKYRERSKTKS